MDKAYLEDQKNKQHKKIRRKIEKKRKMQKQVDEKKKEKKWKKMFLKSQIGKKFHQLHKDFNANKLTMLLFEYQSRFPEETENLIKIGKFLDLGKTIDTEEVENKHCQLLLESIFQTMGLECENHRIRNPNPSLKIESLLSDIIKK